MWPCLQCPWLWYWGGLWESFQRVSIVSSITRVMTHKCQRPCCGVNSLLLPDCPAVAAFAKSAVQTLRLHGIAYRGLVIDPKSRLVFEDEDHAASLGGAVVDLEPVVTQYTLSETMEGILMSFCTYRPACVMQSFTEVPSTQYCPPLVWERRAYMPWLVSGPAATNCQRLMLVTPPS